MVRITGTFLATDREQARLEWLQELDAQAQQQRARREFERTSRLMDRPIQLDDPSVAPPIPVEEESITGKSRRRSLSAIRKFEAMKSDIERQARYIPRMKSRQPPQPRQHQVVAAPDAATIPQVDYFWNGRVPAQPRVRTQSMLPREPQGPSPPTIKRHESHAPQKPPKIVVAQMSDQLTIRKTPAIREEMAYPAQHEVLESFRLKPSPHGRMRSQLVPEDPEAARRDAAAREWRMFLDQQIEEKRAREQSERERLEQEDRSRTTRAIMRDMHLATAKAQPQQQPRHLLPTGSHKATFPAIEQDTRTDSTLLASRAVYTSRIPRPKYLLHIKTTAAEAAGWIKSNHESPYHETYYTTQAAYRHIREHMKENRSHKELKAQPLVLPEQNYTELRSWPPGTKARTVAQWQSSQDSTAIARTALRINTDPVHLSAAEHAPVHGDASIASKPMQKSQQHRPIPSYPSPVTQHRQQSDQHQSQTKQVQETPEASKHLPMQPQAHVRHARFELPSTDRSMVHQKRVIASGIPKFGHMETLPTPSQDPRTSRGVDGPRIAQKRHADQPTHKTALNEIRRFERTLADEKRRLTKDMKA